MKSKPTRLSGVSYLFPLEKILFSLVALLLIAGSRPTFAVDPITSPGGMVSAVVSVVADDADDAGAALVFRVIYKDVDVIETSRIGISIDGFDLGSGVSLSAPKITQVDDTYATRGKHAVARNHYTSAIYDVGHRQSNKNYRLEFRIYDDGVAYRYSVPGAGVQHVDGESSSWKVIAGATAWYFERLTKGWKLKSYAGQWLSTAIENLHTATPKKIGPVQGTPIVLKLPNDLGFAAITKAATYRYSGMRLHAVGDRTLVADFTEGEAGFDVQDDVISPWRVTMLADDLNQLVNSDLIENLNRAPDPDLFADTSYIRPGRSVWSWETLGLGTPDTQRTFIDLAAELGFEFSTIDDGWKDWDTPWQTVKALVDHARGKNVGVWLWVHSRDILDPTDDYQQMQTYFDKVAQAGAVGLKIDFMNGETKAIVDFETAVLTHAAARKLMVNFHGCHASTGESRTFPNEMTREGIRGIELNKMKEGPLTASHNAALPFTRFVVGHADYTPVLHTNPGPTTWTQQLAMLIVSDSPLQTYAEHPDTMMNAPVVGDALDVMLAIPTVWDETVVLPGSRIGEMAAFARRTGDDWFVGVVNGSQQQTLNIDFCFLPAGIYQSDIISDDLSAAPVSVADIGVNEKARRGNWTTTFPLVVTSDSIAPSHGREFTFPSGGGLIIRLKKTP